MSVRLDAKDRQGEILEAALLVAQKMGFANIRQKDIAERAGCGYGTVTLHFKTMTQMRREIMRAAIKREILPIIAQGLGMGDPNAKKAPAEIKKKALASLA
jgi:AcrR family transcriptional regulator